MKLKLAISIFLILILTGTVSAGHAPPFWDDFDTFPNVLWSDYSNIESAEGDVVINWKDSTEDQLIKESFSHSLSGYYTKQWDFGEKFKINWIRLWNNEYVTYDITDVWASNDGTTWTSVNFTETTNQTSSGNDATATLTDYVYTRYIKIRYYYQWESFTQQYYYVYGYGYDSGQLISRNITYEEVQQAPRLVYDNSEVVVDILDKTGTVLGSDVPPKTDLSVYAESSFPIKIRATLYNTTQAPELLDYIGIIDDRYCGYVYYKDGTPAYLAQVFVDDGINTYSTTTDIYGFFEFTGLNLSLTYQVTIYDRMGNLMYTDAIIPPLFRIYDFTTQEYVEFGNPYSNYLIKLSTERITAGDTVKVYVVKKSLSGFLWWKWEVEEYIEGAEIYIDGASTGKKTQYHSVFWWIPFIGDKPYAEVTIDSAGTHWIYAKIEDEFSRAKEIYVSGEYSRGGAEEGNYPGTLPDEDETYYKLWADKTVLYQSGEVTFKVYKIQYGESRGTVEADIYVNGEKVGTTTSGWFWWADKELKYKFNSPGSYLVYADIEGKKTGNLIITVLESDPEKPPADSGTLNLSVTVKDIYGNKLGNILVQRKADSTLWESKFTNYDGKVTLHPESGVNYTILAIDPSNNYLPVSKTGSWTSDDSLTLVMRKAGDINDDNQPDLGVSSIQVRVDSYAEDGISLYIGKHRITVVDDYGKELSGAEIYINGEKVGETSGSIFGLFGAGLDYNFGAGEYTVKAIYNDMFDTITVIIKDLVDPEDPNAIVIIAIPEGGDTYVIGNLTVKRNQKVCFIVCEQDNVNSIWDWDRISGAHVFINGKDTGITAKTDFGSFFGFGGHVGYVHEFNESGTYSVNATTQEGDKTQTIYVTVTDEEYESLAFGAFGELLDYLATQFPLLGNKQIDRLIWGIIVVVGGLLIVSIAVRIIV